MVTSSERSTWTHFHTIIRALNTYPVLCQHQGTRHIPTSMPPSEHWTHTHIYPLPCYHQSTQYVPTSMPSSGHSTHTHFLATPRACNTNPILCHPQSTQHIPTSMPSSGPSAHTHFLAIIRALSTITLHPRHMEQNLLGEVWTNILQKLGGGGGRGGLRMSLGLNVMCVPLWDVPQHVVQGLHRKTTSV